MVSNHFKYKKFATFAEDSDAIKAEIETFESSEDDESNDVLDTNSEEKRKKHSKKHSRIKNKMD
jgi:hypothetical protein